MEEYQNDGFCQFCRIFQTAQKNKNIIQIDQEFFSFHDIDKASAKQHILICTKTHIQTALEIPVQLIGVFDRMRQFGAESLKLLNKDYKQDQFKFGFHLKPNVSVYHIHMHGFVLPFKNMLIQKIKYGKLLYSIQEVTQKIKLKQLIKL